MKPPPPTPEQERRADLRDFEAWLLNQRARVKYRLNAITLRTRKRALREQGGTVDKAEDDLERRQ